MMTPTELNNYLSEWDNATKTNRFKILEEFINTHNGKTAPELEQSFSNAASLFFTRLTAWLRLSYMNGYYVETQLKCIRIFIGASSGHKFLTEFVEVGGILTVLEILGLQLEEGVKKEALRIIEGIAISGRTYKELICESFGVRAIAECLAKSNDIACHEACKNALKELSRGNPRYQNQIYKVLIAVLRSSSPEAQQIAAQLLQDLQVVVDNAIIGIVDPSLMLLRSLHMEVQYEGFQLIKLLMRYENIKLQLLGGLVALLKPLKVDMQDQIEMLADPDRPDLPVSLPVFIQQAAAAKLIRMLAKDSKEVAQQCIEFNCVHNLLYAMGNEKHADSQKQAGITLQYLVYNFQQVESKVRDAMGQTFFFDYMNNADGFYLNASPIHIDILLGNKVKMK